MASNFSNLLSKKADDIKPVPLLPAGTYNAMVKSVAYPDRAEWDVIDVSVSIMSPTEDVDTDELAEYGPLKPGSVVRRISFMFSKDPDREVDNIRSENRLKTFLNVHLGGLLEGKTSISEALANAINQPCTVVISHQQDRDDKTIIRDNVVRTGKAL